VKRWTEGPERRGGRDGAKNEQPAAGPEANDKQSKLSLKGEKAVESTTTRIMKKNKG